MKARIVKCQHCKSEFESKNKKKRFCSDRCRVYWNREKDYPSFAPPNAALSEAAKEVKELLDKSSTKGKQKLDPKPGSLRYYLKSN